MNPDKRWPENGTPPPTPYPPQQTPYAIPPSPSPQQPQRSAAKIKFGPRLKLRLIIVAIASLCLVVGLVVLLAVLQQSNPAQAPAVTGSADPADQYAFGIDSPIGLIPEVAASQSGTFSLTLAGTAENIPLNGAYYIEPSGEVWFELITATDKANELLDYLASKSPLSTTAEASDRKVTRFASFDFGDITGGKELLFDYPSFFSGLIPQVEAEIKTSTPGSVNSNYTIITDQKCQTATAAARSALSSTRLNTRVLNLNKSIFLDTTTYELTPVALKEKNDAIRDFIAACFTSPTPDAPSAEFTALQTYYEAIKASDYRFSYTKSNDTFELVVTKDKTEFATLSLVPEDSGERAAGDRKSILERNMLFGAAYQACRSIPVVVPADTSKPITFVAEDNAYALPSENDKSYYCSVNDVPSEAGAQFKDVTVSIGASTQTLVKDSVDYFSVSLLRDLSVELEKIYLAKGYYPALDSTETPLDLSAAQADGWPALVSEKRLSYNRYPTGCQTDCQEFELSLILSENVTLRKRNFNSTVRQIITP